MTDCQDWGGELRRGTDIDAGVDHLDAKRVTWGTGSQETRLKRGS